MDNEEIFDNIANEYDKLLEKNLSHYGKDIDYYSEYKVKLISQKIPAQPQKILEFGCGIGRNIEYLKQYFPESNTITGSDISKKSLEYAKKQKKNKGVSFLEINELKNKSYDLIFVAGVFHHIPPEERRETMRVLHSLLAEEGRMFIFEHNPYNPLTRRAVNTCPFDEGVTLLNQREFFKLVEGINLQVVKMRFCLFFPSVLKKLAFLERFIWWLPFGGQYVVEIKRI